MYLAGTSRVIVGDTTALVGFVTAMGADGAIAWSKGVARGEAVTLTPDGAGGVLVAGFESRLSGENLIDAPWVARIGTDGSRAWATGLATHAKPAAIARTTDGAVIAGVAIKRARERFSDAVAGP